MRPRPFLFAFRPYWRTIFCLRERARAERTKKARGCAPFQRLFRENGAEKCLTACALHGIISTCVGMSHGICHTVKVAGIKQTMRALREHRAEKLYIACDADPAVLEAIEALGCEQGLKIDRSATMAQLGHSAGIAVGAAVITILSE